MHGTDTQYDSVHRRIASVVGDRVMTTTTMMMMMATIIIIIAAKEPSGLLRTDGKRPDGVTQLP